MTTTATTAGTVNKAGNASTGALRPGQWVRQSNGRPAGDTAWHQVTEVVPVRNPHSNKPYYEVRTSDHHYEGTQASYAVRWQVFAGTGDPNTKPAKAVGAARLPEANTVAAQLDAAQAKHLGPAPKPGKTRPRVAPTAEDQAKTAQHTAETRGYLAKLADEDRAKAKGSARSAENLAALAATRKAQPAPAAKPAKQAPTAKPATAPKATAPKTQPAGRKQRTSPSAWRALEKLAGSESRSLTRRELHADPMVVKSLRDRGWVTVTVEEKERGLDLVELTTQGAAQLASRTA